jgi:hypothetical protein
LKPLESWADRVYQNGMSCEDANRMRLQPDELAKAHPKVVGLLAAAGGAYVMVNLYFLYNT